MSEAIRKGKDCIGVTVVFICHDGAGNMVMQMRGPACRDEQGAWDSGGGGVETGDTIAETLAEEIRQEYGVPILESEELGRREVFRGEGENRTHWIAFDFLVRVDREQVLNGEPHKFSEIAWFPILDVLNGAVLPIHSQLPYTLNKYRDRLEALAT